jgi:nitrogen fixation/metabolism regulation signal transduction histidine kinase
MKREISYEEIEKDLADFKKVLESMREGRRQIIKTMEASESKIEKALDNLIENIEFQATELRRREEELADSYKFTNALLDNIPAPFLLVDENGKWKIEN